MRILVVDDNPTDRELAAYLLEADGHDVEVAATGMDALRSMRRTRPDVAAIDLCMPRGIDGFELLRLIRSDPDLSDLRAVAVTADGTLDTTHAAAIDAGFDEYVQKPVCPPTFAAVVTGSPG